MDIRQKKGKKSSLSAESQSAAGAGEPKPLFSLVGATGFAPTRDGNRFLVTMSDPAVDPWPISIVLNWTALLKK